MNKQRAMVVGVTGMVGGALAQKLLQADWEVLGTARFRDAKKKEAVEATGVRAFEFDVTKDDPSQLPDADILFLQVWDPTREDLIWPINYYGVGRLVERYVGQADVVNGCTINVYGDRPEMPDEETPCRPTSDYGRSRYAQEKLIDYFCWRKGGKAIHLRYAHSNTARQGLLRHLAEGILAGKSLGANPDAKVQVMGLEDFVRVTIGSVDHVAEKPLAVNCCHPRIWTFRELALELQRRLGRGEVVFDRQSGGVEHSAYADPRRMIEWFDQPEVSVDTLLDRVVADLKQGV